MSDRYILQHSEHLPDGWVLTDTKTSLVCRFLQHRFNETQQFTFLDEDKEVMRERDPKDIAKMVNDLTQWGATYHYNILMPATDISPRLQIGREISYYRNLRGMTIRQLAELSGVNYVNISKIENGKYNVSVDILSKIAKALGLRLAMVE